MDELLREMHEWMTSYMKSFYTEDAEVMKGIRIKEVHTGYVTANAVALAKSLGLSQRDVQLAEVMGLFHDVGRFRQYSLYQTFNDALSEDHAELGLKVLSELPFLGRLAPEEASLVRFAISRHNKKEIGPGTPREIAFAKLLRDADKLDIYRVLEPFLAPDGAKDAPKFMQADASNLVSPYFVRALTEGLQADYKEIKTHGDRKVVRLLWLYDINYNWTMREIVKRGYVEKIIGYLPEQAELAPGVARLRAYIKERSGQADTWEG